MHFISQAVGFGGAAKLAKAVSACGFEVLQELETYFVPSENELAEYYDVGVQLASRIKTQGRTEAFVIRSTERQEPIRAGDRNTRCCALESTRVRYYEERMAWA